MHTLQKLQSLSRGEALQKHPLLAIPVGVIWNSFRMSDAAAAGGYAGKWATKKHTPRGPRDE